MSLKLKGESGWPIVFEVLWDEGLWKGPEDAFFCP
jgi:hypothetical protein